MSSIDIYYELTNFANKLEKNPKLYSNDKIEKILINVNYIHRLENTDRCHAIVNNINGERYQCTRSAKHNNLCGLHHGRKNSFECIDLAKSNTTTKTITINLTKQTSNMVNGTNKLYNDPYYQIYFNGNNYHIDIDNGDIYSEEYYEYNYLGNIETINIPIRIY